MEEKQGVGFSGNFSGYAVLVTGGAGFIGSNLCRKLLDLGNRVVCFDNFSTGRFDNIEDLLQHRYFKLFEGDIRDKEECSQVCQNIDFVFHQAALGSVPRSLEDPQLTNEVNVTGFLNMLVAARDAGVKRFIYAASSSTYGDSPELPKEEDRIGKPLSPYAVTKYVNELYADVFYRSYGLECIGLRYFNVFGEWQRPDGAYAAVIPRFIGMLMRKESPVIHGNGDQSRDFTYVANAVQANIRAATTKNPDALNTVYNVACGERTTVNELFLVIRKVLSDLDPEIGGVEADYGPSRQGDVKHSLASVQKAERLLGYKPTHSFSEGIAKAVPWYYKNLKAFYDAKKS